MKIKILGSGSAFSVKNFQSNYLISDETRYSNNLLIDCGSDIRFSLAESGMSYKDISRVYISHLHADHCGGLEYLAFCSYFDPNFAAAGHIGLYCQSRLMRDLWEHSLQGGLGSVEGSENELEDYFVLHPMYINKPVVIDSLGTLQLVQTVHIMNGYGIVPTFGLMVTTLLGYKIYFTTDTQFCPDQIMCFYKEADLIIQDCETTPFESKVHANFKKLQTLPPEIKKKMWLTHYQEGFPTIEFMGFLDKGQEIII